VTSQSLWSLYDRHFCGYNTTYCVELNGDDLSCYSNKNESDSLRKCPHDHGLTNKAYFSAVTVTNIFQSFTYKMAAKSPGIDREQNYVIITLCISTFRAVDHAGARVLHCVPQNVYLFIFLNNSVKN